MKPRSTLHTPARSIIDAKLGNSRVQGEIRTCPVPAARPRRDHLPRSPALLVEATRLVPGSGETDSRDDNNRAFERSNNQP